MPTRQSQSGSELFIVDNSDEDWKVARYLHDWCQLSSAIDIASGFFEIGAFLALKEEWQKVDKFRLLIGDEVSKRTRHAFTEALKRQLDRSVEHEKVTNAFLDGVAAIVEGIRSGKIECRVYRKDKFHAKAYITHARLDVVGASALVGSSNFTAPGLLENIELNVRITGTPVAVLQEWYEQHWKDAEPVSAEVLTVLERQMKEYSPFEVYARSLSELFRGHELTAGEWEQHDSVIYKILAPYQREGYHALMKRALKYNGAFLCDGVGLGKTFIGLMLIERLIMHEHQNVALFVPKSGRTAVWERNIKKRLPHLYGAYSQLAVFNHTDLLRGGEIAERLESVRNRAQVIIVDEAHHFRNTGIKGDGITPQSRYWKLHQLAEGKTVYLLTATPVNNSLLDFQHMIELFSRNQADYFKDAPLGIHSLPGHFRKLEKSLAQLVAGKNLPGEEAPDTETNQVEAERVLGGDDLFRALVVQRSRAYVKQSCAQEGDGAIPFPKPKEPKVVPYSVKQTYGNLLTMVEAAFAKKNPLFSLPIYYPYAYYKGDNKEINALEMGRQQQVVRLIRIGFLKRFESSVEAFRSSCWNLLVKLLAWVTAHASTDHERGLLDRWRRQHADLITYVQDHQVDLFGEGDESEADEDVISPEMLEAVKRLDPNDFKIAEIIAETLLDMDQLAAFLYELKDFTPGHDKKLQALVKLLQTDSVLKQHKVLIFSEFMATARYLKKQLLAAGLEGVEEVDSAVKTDRGEIIVRFAPYYNGSSSQELVAGRQKEIRILISTDVLSEGLNLQDATRLINYDLHWNPVRLMQRIGRVDRRMDPIVEAAIVKDHPDQAPLRGEVAYWNFLPPGELDELLGLYKTVSNKTLKISETLGIEGRKLLHPDDQYNPLRDFTEAYEGALAPVETMHLEYQALLKQYPGIQERLAALPGQVFSGKAHLKEGTKAVFFFYALPAPVRSDPDAPEGEQAWSLEAGTVQWYLYNVATEAIISEPTEIAGIIRSTPQTPRLCSFEQPVLKTIKDKVDRHLKNTYLRRVQAPMGVEAELRAWMELN